jgi:hypothetical protein
MNILKVGLGGIVGGLLVLVGSLFTGGEVQQVSQPSLQDLLGAVTARTTITNPWTFTQAVTFSSAPTLSASTVSVNGISTQYSRTASLTQASTTVCAIQSPSATSTLLLGSLNLTVSSTTASRVTFAKALGPAASTTLLGQAQLGANAQGTFLASTTPTVLVDPIQVFSPSTWFTVSMSGGNGTFSPTGVCTAVFQEVD